MSEAALNTGAAAITHPLTPRKKVAVVEDEGKNQNKTKAVTTNMDMLRLTIDGDPHVAVQQLVAAEQQQQKQQQQQQQQHHHQQQQLLQQPPPPLSQLRPQVPPQQQHQQPQVLELRAEETSAGPPSASPPSAAAADLETKSADQRSRRRTMSEWPVDERREVLVDGQVASEHQSSDVFLKAHEIHEPEWSMCPFPSSIVASFSCHGVEPSHFVVGAKAKINQDRGCIVHPYGGDALCSMFAVFDGHGKDGDVVSEFAMSHFRDELRENPNYPMDIGLAMREAMIATNRSLEESDVPDIQSGTTAVVALLKGETITFANAGDSRAVLARRKGDGLHAIDLTIDQNPDLPEEKARIEAAGGFVKPSPEAGYSARVYLDPEFTSCGLAMGRSIGDRCVKGVGVIAEPVISTLDICEGDEFMILASDGIWEFMTSQEAVDCIAPNLHRHGAKHACKQLIVEAANRWKFEEDDYRDDITAIVIRLNPLRLTPDVTQSYLTLDEAEVQQPHFLASATDGEAPINIGHKNGVVMLDCSGDGRIDTVAVDTTGDATADTFYDATLVDTLKDGVFDHVQIDTSKGRTSRPSFHKSSPGAPAPNVVRSAPP